MRVIGFDPGLRRTGWGVVEVEGQRLRHVAHGVCGSGAGDLATRLAALCRAIEAVIEAHGPEVAAVEHTFVNKDPVATLKLGQARAIALLVPARAGLPVAEYAPNAVKKALVGVGHADKRQVGHMIGQLLPGLGAVPEDAADALAVAICHGWSAGTASRLDAAVAAAREGAQGGTRR